MERAKPRDTASAGIPSASGGDRVAVRAYWRGVARIRLAPTARIALAKFVNARQGRFLVSIEVFSGLRFDNIGRV